MAQSLYFLGPSSFFFRALLSDISNLHSSLKVRDYLSHPYKIKTNLLSEAVLLLFSSSISFFLMLFPATYI
jgi:hypothetical protein